MARILMASAVQQEVEGHSAAASVEEDVEQAVEGQIAAVNVEEGVDVEDDRLAGLDSEALLLPGQGNGGGRDTVIEGVSESGGMGCATTDSVEDEKEVRPTCAVGPDPGMPALRPQGSLASDGEVDKPVNGDGVVSFAEVLADLDGDADADAVRGELHGAGDEPLMEMDGVDEVVEESGEGVAVSASESSERGGRQTSLAHWLKQ